MYNNISHVSISQTERSLMETWTIVARKSLQPYYNVSCVDHAWRLAVGRLARSCRRRTTDRKPGREWLQSPRRKKKEKKKRKETSRAGRKERKGEDMEVDGRFSLAVHHYRLQRPIGRSHFNPPRGASVITRLPVCSLLMRSRWYDNYVIARGIKFRITADESRGTQERRAKDSKICFLEAYSSRVIYHTLNARV